MMNHFRHYGYPLFPWKATWPGKQPRRWNSTYFEIINEISTSLSKTINKIRQIPVLSVLFIVIEIWSLNVQRHMTKITGRYGLDGVLKKIVTTNFKTIDLKWVLSFEQVLVRFRPHTLSTALSGEGEKFFEVFSQMLNINNLHQTSIYKHSIFFSAGCCFPFHPPPIF